MSQNALLIHREILVSAKYFSLVFQFPISSLCKIMFLWLILTEIVYITKW